MSDVNGTAVVEQSKKRGALPLAEKIKLYEADAGEAGIAKARKWADNADMHTVINLAAAYIREQNATVIDPDALPKGQEAMCLALGGAEGEQLRQTLLKARAAVKAQTPAK